MGADYHYNPPGSYFYFNFLNLKIKISTDRDKYFEFLGKLGALGIKHNVVDYDVNHTIEIDDMVFEENFIKEKKLKEKQEKLKNLISSKNSYINKINELKNDLIQTEKDIIDQENLIKKG